MRLIFAILLGTIAALGLAGPANADWHKMAGKTIVIDASTERLIHQYVTRAQGGASKSEKHTRWACEPTEYWYFSTEGRLFRALGGGHCKGRDYSGGVGIVYDLTKMKGTIPRDNESDGGTYTIVEQGKYLVITITYNIIHLPYGRFNVKFIDDGPTILKVPVDGSCTVARDYNYGYSYKIWDDRSPYLEEGRYDVDYNWSIRGCKVVEGRQP